MSRLRAYTDWRLLTCSMTKDEHAELHRGPLLLLFGFGRAGSPDETQRVESAPLRWAEGGSGGSPDFFRHIVPLFSKLGCNYRACHGWFQGQSGFRLSLFGFGPAEDLKELLEDDGDGLRANVKDPDASLALFKPTHEDEHEGGQRTAG